MSIEDQIISPNQASTVPDIDSVNSLSELEAIKKQLQAEVDKVNASRTAIEKSLSAITEEQNEETVDINKELEEVQKMFEKLNNDLYELKHKYAKKFRDLRDEKSGLNTKANTLSNLIAQVNKKSAQMFDAESLKKELDELVKDFSNWERAVWFQLILEYQKFDVAYIERAYNNGLSGVLNANVMGAGKTMETIVFLQKVTPKFKEKHGRHPRILWVTKKSLLNSSAKEIMKWNPEQPAIVLKGGPDQRQSMVELSLQFSPIPVVVCNYEVITRDDFMINLTWDFVVVDEVHKLKGGVDVKIFARMRELLRFEKTSAYLSGTNKFVRTEESPFFLPLSGSPVQNRPQDMWAILHLFRPEDFPSVRHFERHYCTEVYIQETGKYMWRAKTDALLAVLKDQAVRQDPALVRAAWPDKTRTFIEVEHTDKQKEIYDKARAFILEGMNEKYGSAKVGMKTIIEQLIRLRQINVWPGAVKIPHPKYEGQFLNIECDESAKVDAAVDLGMELHNDGEQFLVWSAQFNAPLEVIADRFRQEGLKVAIINGSTKNAEAIEKLFQEGELDCLLLNRAAAAEGFNFQKNPSRWPGGASHAIFLDLWYNPKANEQAEDRIWRTGQNENVTIHILQHPNTVDDLIRFLLDQKEIMIEGVVGNDESSTLSFSMDDIQDMI